MKVWTRDIADALGLLVFIAACIYGIPLGFFLITGIKG